MSLVTIFIRMPWSSLRTAVLISIISSLLFIFPVYISAQPVFDLMDRADMAMDNQEWNEAIKLLSEIYNSSEYKESLPLDQYITSINNLAYSCWQNGQPFEAQSYYVEVVNLKKEINEIQDAVYVKALRNLGSVLLEVGNYDQAIVFLETSVDVALNNLGTNSPEYADALNGLASFHNETGNYREASELYLEANGILKLIGDLESPEFAESCGFVGRLMVKNGEFEEAEEYLSKSVDIYSRQGESYQIEYTEGLESLGVLYEIEGKYADSEKILMKALTIKRSIPDLDQQYIIETLNDLGILYQHLGNYAKAEDFFMQVHDLCIETMGRDNGFYAVAVNNLATMAEKQGEFKRANQLFTEALEVYARVHGTDHPLYSDVLNNLASTESELGLYEEGAKHYEEVLRLDRAIYGVNHPNYATALNNYGILLFRKGEIVRAEELYLEALSIRKEVLGTQHPSYARSLESLGLYYYSQDDVVQSEKYFREAIDVQKAQISDLFPVLTDNERSIFYETIIHDIERYNHIALDLLDRNPELITYILDNQVQTKAILMNASEKVRRKILSSTDQELIANYKQWSLLKNELVRYYQIGKSKLADYGIDLAALEKEIDVLEKQMVNSVEQFDDINSRQSTTWQEVRATLEDDQALVEIVKIRNFDKNSVEDQHVFGFSKESDYLAIVLKKNEDPQYVVMKDGLNLEEIHYPFYSNSLQYQLGDKESYKYFWKDIDKVLGKVKEVYVSPDGVYHKLNPNIFKVSGSSYLIDNYYVSYVTNCTDLLIEKRGPVDYKRAYLIGNPTFNTVSRGKILAQLPGAEKEINEIEVALTEQGGWDVRKYANELATESGLKSLYEPTLLHIATHGFFSSSQDVISSKLLPTDIHPLFKSGIYLAGAEDTYQLFMKGEAKSPLNDGILTAYEAMQLNLDKTEIVILSACNTGLGDIANGEGVYGLQRAFIVAGARNLIISLTEIDDEATQKTMNYFYKYFQETNQIMQSLRRAQLSIREEYKNPYVWGSFILIGKGKQS